MSTDKEKLAQAQAEFMKLYQRTGSSNREEALHAQEMFAKALEGTIRDALLDGDNTQGIYMVENFGPFGDPEYPVDLLAPGEEDQYVAYTGVPGGRIPERHIEADYLKVPTFQIQSSIDFLMKYAKHPNLNTVSRALEILQAGFQKKINMDSWHTLLLAGVDRNIVVYDGDASQGAFTKRLVSLMKTVMMRNGGGNTFSVRQRKLTDAFMSVEGVEDIRNWGLDQVDDMTRREIFLASDGASTLTRVFGVNIHPMVEFGEDQPYQDYFVNKLSGDLGTDVELVVGIDMTNRRDFVNPIREDVQIFSDPNFHRRQAISYYGWMESGYAVLDNRSIILGSF